jgi:hypothetical protein
MKNTFVEIGGKLGVPFLILLLIGLGTREAGMSIHTTIIVPLLQKHTELIDVLCETQQHQTRTLDQIADMQIEIKRAIIVSGSRNFQCEDTEK